MDYKDTLNLPKTNFPMRANLPQNEPKQLENWNRQNIYFKLLEARKGKPKFVLHDGPPYANGNIHLGHALNKTLKDIIVKYRAMTGHYAPYVPGWDCHGLPIELQVEKDVGRAKKAALSAIEIRRLCKKYAEKFVSIQREEFKRLGVFGDWRDPYLTLDPGYEAQEVRELGKLAHAGIVYRQKKPVYWCSSCVTALAEAEVEYEDHTAPSIYVKFPVVDSKGKFSLDPALGTHFVIWTTTPWTLPANQAIALNPRFTYRKVRTPQGELIMSEERIGAVLKAANIQPDQFERGNQAWTGAELEGIVCRHPWLERNSRIILGDFVTQDQGTGAVHIAPGHGQEDYAVGLRYGLEVLAPVDAQGKFTAEARDLQGDPVFKADPKIIQILAARGALLAHESLVHSYPHCWRCKKPVIFRAAEQWFVSLDKNGLRNQALRSLDQVRWIPPWGKDRIRGMLETRPDWCISRQRSWGVPIPAVYCNNCNQAILSQQLCEHVAAIFEREGSDAWFIRPVSELVPAGFQCPKCGGTEFSREKDILDVWFDSGVSHAAVVEMDPRLGGRADLYLEGSDQHRGWFHTALLTSVGTRGRPPYKNVLTHGFTLDGKGRKMSKSLGNVIAPQEITKKFGAEVLRLWASAEDYREDVRISEEILNRLVEAYRRLRNTGRFLLSNLYDFDPGRDSVPADDLEELDQWVLHETENLLARCRDAYERYEFHLVFHSLNNFCSVDLSALYLDIVKDRLYCEPAASRNRRAAQTALYRILDVLVHLMAPVLSFTADEIWAYMPQRDGRPQSVFLSEIPSPERRAATDQLAEKWERLFKERGEILKALEGARSGGIIGHSLDAEVILYPRGEDRRLELSRLMERDLQNAEDILIVSRLTNLNGTEASFLRDIEQARKEGRSGIAIKSQDQERSGWGYHSDVLDAAIAVFKAPGRKCERCWKYKIDVGSDAAYPTVCTRCAKVLHTGVFS